MMQEILDILLAALLVGHPTVAQRDRTEVRAHLGVISEVAHAISLHPRIVLGIALTESSLRHVVVWRRGGEADIGLLQISTETARAHSCRVWLLVTGDPDETVACAVSILREKRTICGDQGLPWWTCWHSTTPRHREGYYRRVLASIASLD